MPEVYQAKLLFPPWKKEKKKKGPATIQTSN